MIDAGDGDDHSGLGALLRASEHISESHTTVAPSPARTSSVYVGDSPSLARVPSTEDQSASVHAESDSPEPDGYFGESSTFAFVSNVQSGPRLQHRRTDLHRTKRRRISSSRTADTSKAETAGLTPKENTGSYDLPPKHLADSLLDAYFARVHRLYPFVHEQTFLLDYERIYLRQEPESLAESRPVSIALLYMVFAHGAEFCRSLSESEAVGMAADFVDKAKRIVFAQMFRQESLELVQSLLLMCQYLQSTLELNQCWSLVGLMIRTAISLGLHFNPPASETLTIIEREVRKRVWFGCFMIDRTLSMKLGRPPSILSATAFDVDLPLNVDDQYISQDLITPRQPDYRPSLIMFFNHTIQQGRLIEKVLHELYRPTIRSANDPVKSPPHQSATNSHVIGQTVMLDGEVLSWWNNAPPHLKDKPDVSDGPEFELQRNVLYLRYLNLRLLTHRQTFLLFCKQDIDDPFQRAVVIASCRACVTIAREVIEVIHGRRLFNSLWYNLHYVFTSMGVLLSLQTMDKTRLESLGETRGQDSALELGMEYLKAASRVSTLAARYVGMLERIRMAPSTDSTSTKASQLLRGQEEVALTSSLADDTGIASRLPNTQDQQGLYSSLNDMPMFDDSGLIDFNNDLLFGTGLPRDLLSSDWSVFGTPY
ncbi:hypothetical protein CONLIGDRAFT_580431 [Coniochaeta ligniaria NRRL 30616]|uniref:Xylanolytic transcriptional activator regulatory domain-containing protein n=1 Tax=Coniochaeta ligniaria NRRL 30616 TaxID=1408157 RepID=A0A1J7JH54_9PEZI|nr:hypothetical protein CONLIGDRAFT_580431 [Coniochaeta ligniaria NRRL 30616]